VSTSLRYWLKFNAVGIIGIGVQLITLTIFRSGLGIHYLYATFLAVEAAVLHNFVWHELWTWADRKLDGRGVFLRLLKFNMANGLISIAGNFALMWLLVGQMHVHYLPANIMAIGACSLINFFASDRLVFRISGRTL
jgi:putative flippase GtrA